MDTQKKIQMAGALLSANKASFLSDSRLCALLSELDSAISASREAMEKAGVVEICRRCDEEEGGSCCGEGMERHYDEWLLLANLLMGVKLQKERQEARSCLFLGERGCTLWARHTICINYLCLEITKCIDPARLSELRRREGKELELLFHTIEYLKLFVREYGCQVETKP